MSIPIILYCVFFLSHTGFDVSDLYRVSWLEVGRHVACIEEMRNAYKILVRNMEGRDHSEDISICENESLENRVGRCGLDASGSG
jgi:hypothetical protein